MVEHRIDVAGGAITVADEGAGEVVLLLHGWPLDGRVFAAQRARLAQSFRVLTPDRRGFGGATAAPDAALEVADLEALLDTLGTGTVRLCAMADAGCIALGYCARHPGRVRQLVLLGAPVAPGAATLGETERRAFERYRTLAESGDAAGLRRAVLAGPPMAAFDETSRALAAAETLLADYDGADLLAGARPSPSLPEPETLDLRVLVLSGAKASPARQAAAEALAKALPDARLSVLDGTGYLASLGAAETCTAALMDFFAASPPGHAA